MGPACISPWTSAQVSAAAPPSPGAAPLFLPPRLAEVCPLAPSGTPLSSRERGNRESPGFGAARSHQQAPGRPTGCVQHPARTPGVHRLSASAPPCLHPAGCCPTHPPSLPVSCQKWAGQGRHCPGATAPGFLPLRRREPSAAVALDDHLHAMVPQLGAQQQVLVLEVLHLQEQKGNDPCADSDLRW